MLDDSGLSAVRSEFVTYLKQEYLGPAKGKNEELYVRPERTYLVGTLYPQALDGSAAPEMDEYERAEASVASLDSAPKENEIDDIVESANEWYPSSLALSFIVSSPSVSCDVSFGTYTENRDSGRQKWSRDELPSVRLLLSPDAPSAPLAARGTVLSVWRQFRGNWLVTVAFENTARHSYSDGPPKTEDCLFQVKLACSPGNSGQILPYHASDVLSSHPEDEELRLRYRKNQTYAVGHGCSVDWGHPQNGVVPLVWSEHLPSVEVPIVLPVDSSDDILSLQHLSDPDRSAASICEGLSRFIRDYEQWYEVQLEQSGHLPAIHRAAAARILLRIRVAIDRMNESVARLRSHPDDFLAFQLANKAMRDQMLQSRRLNPATSGSSLPADTGLEEPRWRPFQLGFQLMALASTSDPEHRDRGVTDLIWFPTGGGKTEAYLGLAAFEIYRRLLTRGHQGGGTAVITRYTMRLLTSQQFQRAATLVCAMELLRRRQSRLKDTPGISIGLWVGGDTTPNTFEKAFTRYQELLRQTVPTNPFQLRHCPWCSTSLLPERKSYSADDYGFRATRRTFSVFCPNSKCEFHDSLPVAVVDEEIFERPPSFLLATVDKFATMARVEKSGELFGLQRGVYDAPSLIIQDELHLLSGPLGTTVALYEAAVLGLASWNGKRPKVIASTATIRGADEQVRSLYRGTVSMFPPPGLEADESYFATPDLSRPGRLYLGIMPQAHTQSSATVLSLVAMLQGPVELGLQGASRDAYWTVVAYHNSLRELGRTLTIARDDVPTLLAARKTDDCPSRSPKSDGILQLTGDVDPSDLVNYLDRLGAAYSEAGAVDLVATTNMFSVGIDVPRLGIMLMNGQPKTTSEYVQATSRVGRSKVPGLVLSLLRAARPRDRSHYESFKAFHESLYKHIEPTSITPWSGASRRRALRAALVILVRHGAGLRSNADAKDFDRDSALVGRAVGILRESVALADASEVERTHQELDIFVNEWHARASSARSYRQGLHYVDSRGQSLLKNFGEAKDAWPALNSMRSVDRNVRVIVMGEKL
ncbi:helicase-related protein [Arthrobacter sp. 162MFSha1.1]|uniref:helicase-related protein n=1 Tax=Arthrobacter sp. 162MFSha1.1 TaxID=1151119 RepID=UPI0003A3F759|nr:helicase-related protein [Arthrobacter sp. 162MFSha1.1]